MHDLTGCIRICRKPSTMNWKSSARCKRPRAFLNSFVPLSGTGYVINTNKSCRLCVTSGCFESLVAAPRSIGKLHGFWLYFNTCGKASAYLI